ncbi:hypothetical protein [Streptomyces cadmiisoli]|nr:hypothetical protein [Streptomyces cadmiisoli]
MTRTDRADRRDLADAPAAGCDARDAAAGVRVAVTASALGRTVEALAAM